MTHALGVIAGLALIGFILIDAFETVVQPRRVTRRIRPTRGFLFATWIVWAKASDRLSGPAQFERSTRRDRRLGVYGPLSLLLLLGLWATSLIVGFALVYWGLGSSVTSTGKANFGTDLYLSGTTFFTLGLGDVVPQTGPARLVTVVEAATGFSFLALIIGYVPTLYGAFTNREINIVLLDARAGSPPTATELIRRLGWGVGAAELDAFLLEWERWSAELLENYLSYPMLALFRSQHERQSWLAALTMILDACSLLLVGLTNDLGTLPHRQARRTFAMARHAMSDLNQVFNFPPTEHMPDRLHHETFVELQQRLSDLGFTLSDDGPDQTGADAEQHLAELRALYEPYADAFATRFRLALPPWLPADGEIDDWMTTAWQTDPQIALRAIKRNG